MSPRDAKLLPRMLALIDEGENDAEVLQAVHQVRRICGPEAFTGAVDASRVTLNHPHHAASLKLRTLGQILQRARHPDPAFDVALQHVSAALMEGSAVSAEELLLALACMRDLIQDLQHQVRVARAQADLQAQQADLQAQHAGTVSPFDRSSELHTALFQMRHQMASRRP